MEEKITPDKLNKFLLLVHTQIGNMEKDIETLNKFGRIQRKNDIESLSVGILFKEVEKIKDDLELFKNLDINNIKGSIFQEKFMLLLEELK
ncbi:hypothetical protein [Clostridium estertheticum]|uniref:hypothetical protein n=1 Tax=Clostridium estertheticum TaxID=238834 RepID=UPI001C0ABE83|nr:hypothetical protein [Clostridium estertheticum]MBU3174605.1 hypothetical protein [Clostridium estertheticum]MBU3187911.1 hypothetical protein [Clostridium estertheticum]MBX4262930.1 hypothetical protein [Clostridium estertheticum]WLC73098.1 hypothetical protein KTC96_24245 [Clostridium estertheticum]